MGSRAVCGGPTGGAVVLRLVGAAGPDYLDRTASLRAAGGWVMQAASSWTSWPRPTAE